VRPPSATLRRPGGPAGLFTTTSVMVSLGTFCGHVPRLRVMRDLGGIRLADTPEGHPDWLVATDRIAVAFAHEPGLRPQQLVGLDQPTFKDWCRDSHGVVLAETTPGQIELADDAGCRLELLRGSVTMPREPGDSRPENVSHVRGAESSWMLVYAPGSV
jgi:hypothetical protein